MRMGMSSSGTPFKAGEKNRYKKVALRAELLAFFRV
jgi:hypothetical protein